MITIQMIGVEPTKVDLNAQYLPEAIIFPFDPSIRYFVITDDVLGHKMADNTAFFPG